MMQRLDLCNRGSQSINLFPCEKLKRFHIIAAQSKHRLFQIVFNQGSHTLSGWEEITFCTTESNYLLSFKHIQLHHDSCRPRSKAGLIQRQKNIGEYCWMLTKYFINVSLRHMQPSKSLLKLNLFAPGGAQGPDIFPPLLAVICCLSCSCPWFPSLPVSLLLHSATPGSFWSASVSLPLRLPSKGNSTVVVHFFPQVTSNPVPSLPSHLLAYWLCSCHLQHFLVCHMLLPSDAVDSSVALGLEDVKILLLFLCHLPRFTAIEKHWKH